MAKSVTPFVKKSIEVNDTILQIFNDRLALPHDALKKRHTLEEYSGSETRVIKNPPSPQSPLKVAIGAHTDFGSLSFLHNRLGGLQVLVPGSEQWQYIKVQFYVPSLCRLAANYTSSANPWACDLQRWRRVGVV